MKIKTSIIIFIISLFFIACSDDKASKIEAEKANATNKIYIDENGDELEEIQSIDEAQEADVETATSQEPVEVETHYPIYLKDVKGNKIEVTKVKRGFAFSNAKDKVVLLNFLTTWCPPCLAEIPHLNALQKKYKKSLKIISIVLEDKDEKFIKDFTSNHAVKFTLTYGKGNFDLAKAVGDVKAIPFMILYDKAGKYATHYVGAIPEEMITVDIQKVLE